MLISSVSAGSPSAVCAARADRPVRILISGIAGFVGAHVASECVSAGHEILGFDRPGADLARLGLLKGRIRIEEADLLDDRALGRLLTATRPDAVIHLAAQSVVGTSAGIPVLTWQVNLMGTLSLYEAARRLERPFPRIVFIGSGDVYGQVPPEKLPIREDERIAPLNLYSASKAAADDLSGQYVRAYGLPVVRVRPFNHTGPGQSAGFIATDVASQIARAEKGTGPREIRVGDLDPEKDFTDVRDMSRAYRLAAEKGEAGAVYNVGSGKSVPMRRIVEVLAGLSRVPVVVVEDASKRRPGQASRQVSDASVFARATGWKPEIPLEKTLADVLDDWRNRV